MQSDSHQGYAAFYSDALYRITMGNIASAQPDFLVDLGDTVSTDDATETQATVRQKYLNQRTIFGLAAHSMPVFLALGNHENEEGWNLDDFGANRASSLPVLGANARKRYFLNPVPDAFYSGNTDATVTEIDGDHLKEDYYAFEWGNALFVVIDPFWYTMKKPYSGTTGGEKNDEVGRQPLGLDAWATSSTSGSSRRSSRARPRSSSCSPTRRRAGRTTTFARGALGAKYCEWGGYDIDGVTWGFESHRPGWEMPIHQLFVHTGVTAFFHGHDHVFAKETLDGVVYQEVPHAANPDYGGGFSTNPTDYAGGDLVNNSGHVRVTVAPRRAPRWTTCAPTCPATAPTARWRTRTRSRRTRRAIRTATAPTTTERRLSQQSEQDRPGDVRLWQVRHCPTARTPSRRWSSLPSRRRRPPRREPTPSRQRTRKR